jgi:hypothetical protein
MWCSRNISMHGLPVKNLHKDYISSRKEKKCYLINDPSSIKKKKTNNKEERIKKAVKTTNHSLKDTQSIHISYLI